MSRTLVIIRHAKAEAYGPTDAERALTDRGHAEAAAAGGWLAERGTVPDRALVSSAVRTRETWAELAAAAGWSVEPAYDDALYDADVETTLDLVRATPEEVATLVVVGHNPTMAYLAQVLDIGGAPQLATTGFPTAAVAVFEYDEPWTDLAEGSARLVDVRATH